jgi:predicted CoA-binding protein
MHNKKGKHIVFVASPKPHRYSYQAAIRLQEAGHEVELLGFREEKVGDLTIKKTWPSDLDVHTITLYLNARRQVEFYEYLLELQPKRIIFNPGAENPELEELAKHQEIETLNACTLVMLSIGNY